MDIMVDFGIGAQVNAHFNNFTVATDQPPELGGNNTAPAPFDYFLASIATCAGFFVARFCQKRDLSTDNIRILMSDKRNPTTHAVEQINIEIQLPADFPAKYHNAIIKSVNECSVKKALLAPPEINVNLNLT
jgi:putative redox protein